MFLYNSFLKHLVFTTIKEKLQFNRNLRNLFFVCVFLQWISRILWWWQRCQNPSLKCIVNSTRPLLMTTTLENCFATGQQVPSYRFWWSRYTRSVVRNLLRWQSWLWRKLELKWHQRIHITQMIRKKVKKKMKKHFTSIFFFFYKSWMFS